MERMVLTASEGMLLTNGKEIGKVVFLGEHDSPENWHKITEAAAEEIQRSRDEEMFKIV